MLQALQNFFRKLWLWLSPPPKQTLLHKLNTYLGPHFLSLETHDKNFPGYDLASLNLALWSFFKDCADNLQPVGGCAGFNLRNLFDMFAYNPNMFPNASPHQRVPVGVDEEESFPTNALTLCVMKGHKLQPHTPSPEGNGHNTAAALGDEKILVLLAITSRQYDYWAGMDTRNVPNQAVCLSVACRNKDVANRFFKEIEERRKKLSIFRGKVIDPVVGPGGVYTIGFRALQKVQEHDLILPDNIRSLLHSSVLNFYQHREFLETMGIDLKRGILFHGPPGTGKTSISLYLANLLPHFTVCFVSGERLLYPRELCRMARYLQPTMIVFEDIDLVAQERQANGLATVLGELMNQIDGCEPKEQVLFVMNTNSLERLEHAVKDRPGRVDQLIEVPLPNREERLHLLQHFTRFVALSHDLENVVQATDGATPAMLKEIVKRAVVLAISDTGPTNGKPLPLGEAELLLATEQVRRLRDPEIVPGSFGFREKVGHS